MSHSGNSLSTKDSTRVSRRGFVTTSAGATLTTLAGCTSSSDGNGRAGSDSRFPEKDFKIIIPFGSGGGFDTYARTVAQLLGENLSVSAQAQNVTGAGGRVATNQVYNAEANGYTFQIAYLQKFVQNQILYDVEYDMREMTALPQVTTNTAAIAVSTQTDIKTWSEYVDAVQKEELKFYTTGPLGIAHMAPYLTGEISGAYSGEKVRSNSVSYGGKEEGIRDIKAGRVHVMASNPGSLKPYIESGDLRIILSLTMQDSLPDVAQNTEAQTLKKAGVKNGQQIMDMNSISRAFLGPPEIPDGPKGTLRDELSKVIQSDEYKSSMDESGLPVQYADAESVDRSVTSIYDGWKEREDLLNELARN